MIYILPILFTIAFTFLIALIIKYSKFGVEKVLKISSISLFFVYMFRLFSEDVIDQTFNLLLTDINTPINAYETWLFGVFMSVFILFLRWATVLSLIFVITAPFFKLHKVRIIAGVFGSVVALLNIIFMKQNIIAFLGHYDITSLRSWEFMIESALMLSISISILLHMVSFKKLSFKFSKIASYLEILFFSALSVMPQALLYHLFGNYGKSPKDFNRLHVILIVVPIVFMIVSFFLLRKKSQETKNYFITFITFAAFFQYFYMRRSGLGSLPLHLCNTAIILMLLANTFKLKGLFYFNYFANVLGALAAILFPNVTSDFYSMDAMRFAYNHWYAFSWPILAVALNTFKRPTLKDMYRAIAVFSVYYVVVVFLNAWFNNYSSTDYFFTYSDHVSGMFGLKDLQFNHVASFTYHNLTFNFFWIWQILFFFAFILMMFISWYVYDAFFRFSDNQTLLYEKLDKMKIDELKLSQLLETRSLNKMTENHPNSIKISHFSKRYGNSDKYAVKDFSLEVSSGEVFGFLGHNGAGKSTTIKSLVGIQSITEGEMEICGYSIKTQPLEAKLQIGYVSDNHAVYEKLTGREYINYIADLYQVDEEQRVVRLDKLLEDFSLAYAIDREIKSYSHGMKQKLVVIAALIHEPPVWILDEPLTGLDPTSAYQIKEAMKEHAQKGNIVFFSSHVIEVVEKICTRIAIITHGELQGIYDMDEIRKNGISLEELYMSKIKKDEMKNK